MRLWHEALIPYLPRQQLLGLHREVCALRGNGWGKKHATVNYVFEHPFGWLSAYHQKVMDEMEKRGFRVNPMWVNEAYRGQYLENEDDDVRDAKIQMDACNRLLEETLGKIKTIYPEHNDAYLKECLENLKTKGVLPEVIMNLRNSFVCEGTAISEGSKIYLRENCNIAENTMFVLQDGKLTPKEVSPSQMESLLNEEWISADDIEMSENKS